MAEAEHEVFAKLYRLRDDNNRLFVRAWQRLHTLDPEFFQSYQMAISENDAKITRLMRWLCKYGQKITE